MILKLTTECGCEGVLTVFCSPSGFLIIGGRGPTTYWYETIFLKVVGGGGGMLFLYKVLLKEAG